jgi:hypothetical protein
MVREYKLEPLDIPEAARVVKAWFPTEESARAALPKIRKHLEDGGETFTFPGHTHTKPPKGAEPVYIGEFAMSKLRPRSIREAPCPCCTDRFRKFLSGMVAWFSEEQVLRLIGPDCFAALNPEGHTRAKERYWAEQEAAKDRNHLLQQLPKLAEAIGTIRQAAEVGAAVDALHRDLHVGLGRIGLHLWTHVRDEGRLKVSGKVRQLLTTGERAGETVEVEGLTTHTRLEGYRMLAKDRPALGEPLRACAARLEPYNFGERWRASVDAMPDPEVREASSTVNATITEAKDLIGRVLDLRRFAETVNINSLRQWADHPGCPVKAHFASRLGQIAFGRHQGLGEEVDIPRNLFVHIPPLEFWVVPPKGRRSGSRARRTLEPV